MGLVAHSALGAEVPGSGAAAGSVEFKSCHARWSEQELVLGNAHFERKWSVKNGLLTAVSFRDLDANLEWVAKPANRPAPCPANLSSQGTRRLSVITRTGRVRPVEEESLLVELTAAGSPALTCRFQLFPEARGVTMQFAAENGAPPGPSSPAATGASAAPTGIELSPAHADGKDEGDSLEDLLLAPQHLRFTQATLLDQTDVHNELVFENEWLLMPNEAPLKLPGNVFFVEDTRTQAGLVFLKLGPLPHARPVKSAWDAQMLASSRRLRFSGAEYPFVLLAYHGGRAGRIESLQTYQRQLRSYDPQRDAMFLSNTWGDRSRDARINEEFMRKEIEAGARLGVDVVQIDDGWQQGRSANSVKGKGVWNGYWAADPDFWQPDPQRFPGGLAPVVQAAKAKGMKFGLWFGPDSSNEAGNWQKDAARILELHRQEGIDYFKLDSVKAITTGTEQNLRRFWDQVQQESGGRVVFDLDVTAEIRPGYFGAPDVGPIFVENRYTDFHRYWPHQTLRNLWKLSHYVDPLRLRMEFLNNTRKTELYPDDPLAPEHYSPDCLFATIMFANPLGWFECSNLPEAYVTAVSQLVATWKRERSRLFSGTLIPIGAAPDGSSWTGFVSVQADRRSGYVLVFRETNAQAVWSTELPLFSSKDFRLTVLAGTGTAEWSGRQLRVNVPEQRQYLWLRVDSPP